MTTAADKPTKQAADPAMTEAPTTPTTPFNSSRLMEVIRAQTEIAQMGPDLDAVMQRVVERARELTQAMAAIIEMAEGEDMVYRAASGLPPELIGLRLKRAHSLSGLCVEQGLPLYCEDSETDARVDREACRRVGLRSMVVVPLQHRGQVVGVIKVLSRAPHGFWPEDGETLKLMADLIAAAMFHANPAVTVTRT